MSLPEGLIIVSAVTGAASMGAFGMAARETVKLARAAKDGIGQALRHIYNGPVQEDIDELAELLEPLNGNRWKEPW